MNTTNNTNTKKLATDSANQTTRTRYTAPYPADKFNFFHYFVLSSDRGSLWEHQVTTSCRELREDINLRFSPSEKQFLYSSPGSATPVCLSLEQFQRHYELARDTFHADNPLDTRQAPPAEQIMALLFQICAYSQFEEHLFLTAFALLHLERSFGDHVTQDQLFFLYRSFTNAGQPYMTPEILLEALVHTFETCPPFSEISGVEMSGRQLRGILMFDKISGVRIKPHLIDKLPANLKPKEQ